MVIWNECFLTVGAKGRIHFAGHGLLGVRCYLNASAGEIIIGNGVAIAPLTQIYSYSHTYKQGYLEIDSYRVANVHIEDNVLIGSAATILPGVTIGKGAIIGSGAVVIENVPAYTIVGGVPAHFISQRQI